MNSISELRIVFLPLVGGAELLPCREFERGVDWGDRLVGIVGAKGVGKSTLLLQRAAKEKEGGLYLSLDHPLAAGISLLELAESFYAEGGSTLFLDEVHKYPDWSTQLKSIYDTLPKLRVVFSGSSVVRLWAQSGDLSRRASVYTMPTLSLREYIELEGGEKFAVLTLDQILTQGEELSRSIARRIRPVAFFKKYSQHGAYPFYREGLSRYADKLRSAALYTIESDLVQIHKIDPSYIPKLRKLLQLLAVEVPYTPNITALAQSLEVSRATALRYLELLELGGILALVPRSGRGYQKLSKPEKVYFDNTNLLYAFSAGQIESGTIREVFAVSQLRSAGLRVEIPKNGDFLVEKRVSFEVGGKNKGSKQLAGSTDGYVLRDGIETGSGKIIPLWLLGFLY